MKKIFIIYHNDDLINSYIDELDKADDEISIAKKFTSDETDNEKTYMSPLDVKLCLKNNAILYVITRNYISTGVTFDEFENTDMCLLHYDEYNEIPDVIFNKYNILTIWIDSKVKTGLDKKLQHDIQCLEQRLEKVPYEYFLNDDFKDIFNTIYHFLNNEESENDES